jgi:hypothetical protein
MRAARGGTEAACGRRYHTTVALKMILAGKFLKVPPVGD